MGFRIKITEKKSRSTSCSQNQDCIFISFTTDNQGNEKLRTQHESILAPVGER